MATNPNPLKPVSPLDRIILKQWYGQMSIPLRRYKPSPPQVSLAWDFIFERSSSGAHVRAVILQKLIRERAKLYYSIIVTQGKDRELAIQWAVGDVVMLLEFHGWTRPRASGSKGSPLSRRVG
jgi:hypothetical protein